MLRTLLNEKNISLYKLEKATSLNHATLNDLYNERTNIEKCQTSLLFKIADSLDMSMDKLYKILSYNDLSLIAYSDEFDLFKSNIAHELVNLGDKAFLIKHLTSRTVDYYYENNNYLEAMYLLSLIDYLCNKNDLAIVKEYQNIRDFKLNKLYVSKSIYLLLKTKSIKISDLYHEAIDTFLKHNILESEIYNIK